MSIDILLETTKEHTRIFAKKWNWPPEYCVTSLVTRVNTLKQAYGKEYVGRESHLIIKAYHGVQKMVRECSREEFMQRFPYNKFPELYGSVGRHDII